MFYNYVKPILFSILAILVTVVIFLWPIFLSYLPFIISLSISLLAVYSISMVYGRKIELKMGLKKDAVDIKTFIGNRKYRWLFVIVFVIAAIMTDVCSYTIDKALPFENWTSHTSLVGCFCYTTFLIAIPIIMTILGAKLSFVIILTFVILLEKFCANLAENNWGWVEFMFYHFAVWLNIIPVILYLVKLKKTAIVFILILAFLVVPYQLYVGYQSIQIHKEAQAIVDYAFERKSQTGEYPEDLSGYTFKKEYLKKNIYGYNDNFHVSYYVGTPSTNHYYYPETGWGYYDD